MDLVPQAVIDAVPGELKVQILKECPDVPSLQALTGASPAYHAIYRAHRHSILSSILTNTLTTSVQIEAYYLFQARELVGFENIKDFLASYETDRKLGAGIYFPGLPLEFILEITEDVSRVYQVAEIYASFTLSIHSVTREVRDDYEDLSENEMNKLLSALLRVEMFCILSRACEEEEYGQIGPYRFEVSTRTTRFEKQLLAQHFMFSFSPQEIEEIGCIRDWAYRYYWSIFEDYEANVEKKANYENKSEYLLSLGIAHLLSTIRDPSRAVPRAPHILLPSSTASLTSVLRASLSNFCTYDPSFYAANDLNAPLSYDPQGSHIRFWGRVFWDQKRLDEWGFVESEKDGIWEWETDLVRETRKRMARLVQT